MDTPNDSFFIVLRIANGHLLRSYLYSADDVGGVKERICKLYTMFSSNGTEPTREFVHYFDDCIKNGLRFEYPFDGCAYEHESIIVKLEKVFNRNENTEESD